MFLKALKPIKDYLYINIMVDGELAARMSLEIKEKSSKSFSETTKKIIESFSTLTSSFFAFKRFDKLQTNFTKELTTSVVVDAFIKIADDDRIEELKKDVLKSEINNMKIIDRDHLTGLYNRRYLDYQLDKLKDSNSYPVSFITADIDQLKLINDK